MSGKRSSCSAIPLTTTLQASPLPTSYPSLSNATRGEAVIPNSFVPSAVRNTRLWPSTTKLIGKISGSPAMTTARRPTSAVSSRRQHSSSFRKVTPLSGLVSMERAWHGRPVDEWLLASSGVLDGLAGVLGAGDGHDAVVLDQPPKGDLAGTLVVAPPGLAQQVHHPRQRREGHPPEREVDLIQTVSTKFTPAARLTSSASRCASTLLVGPYALRAGFHRRAVDMSPQTIAPTPSRDTRRSVRPSAIEVASWLPGSVIRPPQLMSRAASIATSLAINRDIKRVTPPRRRALCPPPRWCPGASAAKGRPWGSHGLDHGLDRVYALHGAGLEPLGLHDLEPGGRHQRELAAGEVLAGDADGDAFEQPLGGVDGRPGAADVVEQQQAASGEEDALHLAERGCRIRDRAQRQRAHHGVERGVGERQVFGIAFTQVHCPAEVGRTLLRDREHRRAELDPGDRAVGRVVRQVAAGADGDFEDAAAGAGAEPLAAARELDPLEEGDLLVVTGRGLVPHPALLGNRGLTRLRRGGATHRSDPFRRSGLGREQSTSEDTAAVITPITACRTRVAAWAGSGCPASSQAITASIATTGAS